MSSKDYYGVLWPDFWTGRTGREIRKAGGANAQVLALYLMSNRHANMIGLYRISLEDMAHETGLKLKAIEAALQVLSHGFARYDEASEFVWVLNMARFRLGLRAGEPLQPGDRKVVAINKLYHGIESNVFLSAFFEHYASTLRITKLRTPQEIQPHATTSVASKGHQMGHVSPSHASNSNQDQETEISDQETGNRSQEQEKARLTPPATDNVRVITRIARDLRRRHPDAGFTDLKDLTKDECARLRVAYDSEAVGKAVDSALSLALDTPQGVM